jgi:hypothetical protein
VIYNIYTVSYTRHQSEYCTTYNYNTNANAVLRHCGSILLIVKQEKKTAPRSDYCSTVPVQRYCILYTVKTKEQETGVLPGRLRLLYQLYLHSGSGTSAFKC